MGNSSSGNGRAPAKVLVLSHEHYKARTGGKHTPLPRAGNQQDVDNLRELFRSRGIQSLFHQNFTKHEILTTLKYFCEVEVNPSCMAVVIMTHGGNRGTLEAYDETYRTWDVYEALLKCKTKVRLIFFMACRGNAVENLVFTNDKPKASTSSQRVNNGNTTKERHPDAGPFDTNVKGRNVGSLIVRDPEFLVVYSTEDDRVSFRNTSTGTWYIDTLCQELNNMTVPEDIMSLLTRVNKKVSDKRARKKGKDMLQTPCIVSTLTSEFIVGCAPRFFSKSNNSESSNSQLSNYSLEEVFEVTASEVHCLMYHSNSYKKEAEKVTQTIKTIGFKPKQFTELSKLIKSAEKGCGANKKCLFVVIIAPLKRETCDPSWFIMVDEEKAKNVSEKSVERLWHPYRNHSTFNGKPKIFLFLDPFTGRESRPAPGMQSDGSFNHVPEHFNFLRFYGFGIRTDHLHSNIIVIVSPESAKVISTVQKEMHCKYTFCALRGRYRHDFLEQLCLALEKWPYSQRPDEIRRDLSRVICRAMRKSPPVPGCCSYTETTFGVKLMLNGRVAVPIKRKASTTTKKLTKMFSCVYIVGKDRTKMECDATSHDNCHTILDHASSQDGAKRLKLETELPHIEPQAFRFVQTYKRDNTLPEGLTYEDAFDVYTASQTYRNIPHDLVQHCWNIVINNCNTEDQMCAGYNFAVTSRNTDMLDFFLPKITSDISSILQCNNFVTLSTEGLIKILQEDQLNCTEMELFQACVLWCEQQPDFISENLRNFMEPFISHIRFLTMNPSEFMTNDRISDVLSDQEFGAVMKKLNKKECDSWPNTISTNNSSRIIE